MTRIAEKPDDLCYFKAFGYWHLPLDVKLQESGADVVGMDVVRVDPAKVFTLAFLPGCYFIRRANFLIIMLDSRQNLQLCCVLIRKSYDRSQ